MPQIFHVSGRICDNEICSEIVIFGELENTANALHRYAIGAGFALVRQERGDTAGAFIGRDMLGFSDAHADAGTVGRIFIEETQHHVRPTAQWREGQVRDTLRRGETRQPFRVDAEVGFLVEPNDVDGLALPLSRGLVHTT